MNKPNITTNEQTIDLLQKLLMLQLAKEGVPQNDIARIVGVASVKVNAVLKFVNLKKKK